MTFIKLLRITAKEKGQTSLEYFIIFTLITGLSVAALSWFVKDVKKSGASGFQAAVGDITTE